MKDEKDILEIPAADLEALATQSRALFQKGEGPQAPPYLQTRVLAQWRERNQRAVSVRWWQRVAGVSVAFSAVLVLWVVLRTSTPGVFQATANQPVAVKVEMTELKMAQVAMVEIELPEGVKFYSQKFPELEAQRKLSLAWNPELDKASLPFVIQSALSGRRSVKVRFLDGKNSLISERTLEIQFHDEKKG